jgi:hypothetical protein
LFNEIILEAIKNREQKLAKLRDANYDKIISEAKSRWISYEPTPKKCRSVGIDSSWNKRALQGLDLYAIAAIAVTSTNEVVAKEWEDNISGAARGELLEAKAMAMEASLAHRAGTCSDFGGGDRDVVVIICIDGSLISRTLKSTTGVAFETSAKYGDSVFISKTSESRSQFGPLGSRAGDVYYYRHATTQAGFSVAVEAQSRGSSVYEIYMRLRDGMPILRVEIVKDARGASEDDIKEMMDLLRYHSVSGYPYCLKLAHKNCKISNDDIDRLASIYSLQNEQGARDALNE